MSRLYLVPTPIGNLEDITFRAVSILKSADVLLAEDTRTTSKLLAHFGIEKKMLSHHAFNEHHTTPEVIRMLQSGKSVALVSDAGTPGISDPGFHLVRECVRANIPVECLPGATAFVPALVLSGLPCDTFVFVGFLPHKKGRQTALKSLKEEWRTMVFYESPHRVLKTISEMAVVFGAERKTSVSRELTKKFEETIRGTLGELMELFRNKECKGEFVIVVEGSGKK